MSDSLARIHRCRTVLLIEDTMDEEQLALRAFCRVRVPILTKIARNGIQAMDILEMEMLPEERWCHRPDLVLSDMKMPMVTGDEVLRHVRADCALRNVPFVIFSSSDEPVDAERCRTRGCDGYVVKPVDYKQYVHTVQCIVERFLLGATEAKRPPGALHWT